MLEFVLAASVLGAETGAPANIDWLPLPPGPGFYRCMAPLERGVPPAQVKIRCLTASDDRVRDCALISNSRAPDRRYEEAALCAAEHFRIRARGKDGQPLSGVPVEIPFRFAPPPQPRAE